MKTPRQTLSLLLSGLLVFSSIPASAGNALKSALDGKSTPSYHWRTIKTRNPGGERNVFHCYNAGFFLGQTVQSALTLHPNTQIECLHWAPAPTATTSANAPTTFPALSEGHSYDIVAFAYLKGNEVRVTLGPPYADLVITEESAYPAIGMQIFVSGPSPAAVAANSGTGTGTGTGTRTGTGTGTGKKKTTTKNPVTNPVTTNPTTTTGGVTPVELALYYPPLTPEERKWLTFADAAAYDKKMLPATKQPQINPILTEYRKKISDELRKPDDFSKYNEMVGRNNPPAKAEELTALVGAFTLWGAVDKSEIELTADEMAKVNASATLKADYQAETLGVDPKDFILRHRVVTAIRAKLPKPTTPVTVTPAPNDGTQPVVAGGPLTAAELALLTEAERIAYTQSVDAINKNKDLTPEQKTAAIDKLAKEYRQNSLAGAAPYREPKSEADFDALTPAQKSKFCNEKWTSNGGAGASQQTRAIDQANSAAGGNVDGVVDGDARGDATVDANGGGGGGSSWIDKKCREHMGAPDRRRGNGSGNLAGKIPPIGKDTEKEGKKKSEYVWSQDIKAGLAGGILGMVLACTLAPWSAPLLVPALLGFGIGAAALGGTSRFQQYLAIKKKKEG